MVADSVLEQCTTNDEAVKVAKVNTLHHFAEQRIVGVLLGIQTTLREPPLNYV